MLDATCLIYLGFKICNCLSCPCGGCCSILEISNSLPDKNKYSWNTYDVCLMVPLFFALIDWIFCLKFLIRKRINFFWIWLFLRCITKSQILEMFQIPHHQRSTLNTIPPTKYNSLSVLIVYVVCTFSSHQTDYRANP